MRRSFYLLISILLPTLFIACQDEVSEIGSSLTQNEVAIEVDSTFTLSGISKYAKAFDTRSTTNLIGQINVPEYGNLKCDFVAQMLSASSMPIPDSLGVERVDSMKLIFRVPRGSFTGDSLAPQQLKVYRLTKELPSEMASTDFDPSGYYDESSLLGSRSYTLSALSMNDSIYRNSQYIDIQVPMPLELGRQIFTMYRDNDPVLQWPSSFNKWFKGIYVKPSFGRGCVAAISAANMVTYYNYKTLRTVLEDESTVVKEVLMKDSVTLMAIAPEVLSRNLINLEISDNVKNLVAQGKPIVLSPTGYNVEIKFPAKALLEKYQSDSFTMAMVNELSFTLPATTVENDYGIGVPPYLLMVRTSEMDDFFANNKLPDNETSFWAAYDSSTGTYSFTSMVNYARNLIAEGKVENDDDMFTLVPVYIVISTDSYYGTSSVTQCTPYLQQPTMGLLELDKAKIKFTYSKQTIF